MTEHTDNLTYNMKIVKTNALSFMFGADESKHHIIFVVLRKKVPGYAYDKDVWYMFLEHEGVNIADKDYITDLIKKCCLDASIAYSLECVNYMIYNISGRKDDDIIKSANNAFAALRTEARLGVNNEV